ncbi:inner membrane-spanning protein YciB [Altererythrobacter sp.]|uniref:inner membrane-spanning protein YciB n=1 Tax=Altererythrobacter sp. TaxID=1872480 RepID=UPI001B26A2B0|nr:inner membrane-spanning protein YciB [Altererythrobacter sp.]MBO6609698.1 septation protein IspZ [Altererythrobacter sp.]MBO6641152.1 septation protein IspZ [Altererythrobacter sp.]MBO6708150.1 septation protein IspZ [Altererythrobacter sp.]MBO6945715.1 septation protein IspZ [Altererythrobacter sp.]
MSEREPKPDKKPSGWLNVAVDYGPLLIFLGVYRWNAPAEADAAGEILAIIYGTIAFMAAAVAALLFSKFKLGKVSPMLWFSTALIVGFGALTIFFGDPVFVQLKPTIIYSILGLALLIGVWRGRALLQILLEAAFEGLTQEGWLKLSRNWGIFFLTLAALNEALRAYLSFESWLWAKLWVFLPLSFLFTFSQIPMLLKYGLSLEDEAETPPPAT